VGAVGGEEVDGGAAAEPGIRRIVGPARAEDETRVGGVGKRMVAREEEMRLDDAGSPTAHREAETAKAHRG